jgi:hypothetical protein
MTAVEGKSHPVGTLHWRSGEKDREAGPGGPSWSYSGISWTPDAKWLVVSTRDSPNEPYGLWLLSVDTGERHRLLPLLAAAPSGAQDDAPGDFHGALSPDGRVLAFARSFRNYVFHLYTVRLTRDFKPEGARQLLVGQSYGGVLGIAWASNRDIVYSAGDGPQLWRMRVGARSPELLTPHGIADAEKDRRGVLDLNADYVRAPPLVVCPRALPRRWRYRDGSLTPPVARRLLALTRMYDR